MSNAQIIRLLLEFLAIVLATYCIYRQADIAKWERKIYGYIKAFFKAVYCTVKENLTKNYSSAEIIEFPVKK